MDLLQTVRKEGSRGGRAEFSWNDVKNDQHRENYLGHSLMAPVGRWQKGRDLNWYAKGDGDSEQSAAEKRKEEIRKIKQQEEDAMARALGIDIPPRPEDGNNGQTSGANSTPIGRVDNPGERDEGEMDKRVPNIGQSKIHERDSEHTHDEERARREERRRDRHKDRHENRHRHRDRHADDRRPRHRRGGSRSRSPDRDRSDSPGYRHRRRRSRSPHRVRRRQAVYHDDYYQTRRYDKY